MIDPISLAVGGALLASGYFAGRRSGRLPLSPALPKTICSCGHGYGIHESGGACRAELERDIRCHARDGKFEFVRCPCLTYDGPEPLPRVWTNELS